MNFMAYKLWYAKLLKKTNKQNDFPVSPLSSKLQSWRKSRGIIRPEREKDANHILSPKMGS